MTRIAEVRIRKEPWYRRQAVEEGLQRHGYSLGRAAGPNGPGDLLVLWNRKPGADHSDALVWKQRGGTVVVVENGFLMRVDKSMYAFSIDEHHHGLPVIGDEDRFSRLGFEVKPWRGVAGHILVCGQRGIGSPSMASPPQWAEKVVRQLAGMKHPVHLRAHPGNHAPRVPIECDLAGAYACVIWSSNAGVRALLEGVPVVYHAPRWICEGAACRGPWNLGYSDASRQRALHRMSHCQFTVDEISAGVPFERILEGVKC